MTSGLHAAVTRQWWCMAGMGKGGRHIDRTQVACHTWSTGLHMTTCGTWTPIHQPAPGVLWRTSEARARLAHPAALGGPRRGHAGSLRGWPCDTDLGRVAAGVRTAGMHCVTAGAADARPGQHKAASGQPWQVPARYTAYAVLRASRFRCRPVHPPQDPHEQKPHSSIRDPHWEHFVVYATSQGSLPNIL